MDNIENTSKGLTLLDKVLGMVDKYKISTILKSLSSHPREERPLRLSLMTADWTFGGGQKAPDPTDII